jgi:AI-2E family transporter
MRSVVVSMSSSCGTPTKAGRAETLVSSNVRENLENSGYFVPILGPIFGVVIFLLAGLLTIDTLWQAFLPTGLYLGIHLIEGETITPLLLARRFTLNPVLVIISLVFWFWMWGFPEQFSPCQCWRSLKSSAIAFRPLAAFGHFLEG